MRERFNIWIFCIAALVSIGGLLYGYDIGVISGALLFIHKSIALTATQTGFIVGAVLLGSWFGSLLAGPVADVAGRKASILFASVLFVTGVLFILFAHSFIALMLARVLLGLGVGVIAVAVPLYVGELVPAAQRGRYVTMFQLFLTLGIVAAYFIDLLFTPSGNWRGMFAVVLIPAVILFIGSFFMPESPRWLIAKNREGKARKTLALTYDFSAIDSVVHSIKSSMHQREPGFMALFSPKLIRATLVAVAIAVLTQFTGINCFLQYAPNMLKQAGMSSNMAAMIASAGIGSLNFLITLLAICFIDKIGRRALLIFGTCGVLVSEVFLASISHMQLSAATQGMYTLYGLLGFIFFFAIGPGVVVWLAISELFPTQIRGRGIAICMFFNSMAGWGLASMFVNLTKWLGVAGVYWLCAGCTFMYVLVAIFLLPETKGKTLEEVQNEVVDDIEAVNSMVSSL